MELTELDKKVLYYQDRGHLVPSRELIKTPEQIEGIRRSGIVNTGVLDLVEHEIHAGMSTLEIDKLVYEYTKDHGGIPATLGYDGFPKSCCTSINEVVCHGIPNEFDILEEGDIINVDCTTILDGYYADASRMFTIGKTTPQKEKLVRVAKECLEIGMEAAKPFGFVGDIGHAIEKHAKKNGFSVVRDLCGHGVGIEFHEEPDVEHFGKKGTGMLLGSRLRSSPLLRPIRLPCRLRNPIPGCRPEPNRPDGRTKRAPPSRRWSNPSAPATGARSSRRSNSLGIP